MPPLCAIEILDGNDGARIARLVGELDLSNITEVESGLSAAARETTALVVDLAGLGSIDSSGLGVIERLAQKTAVRLVVPDTAVIRRTVHITGLDQIVPVFPTLEEAIAAI